jgi:hypothetical protein
MNSVERYNLAVKTADSIFDDLTMSLVRAKALFRNSEEALQELVFPMIKSTMGVSIGGDFVKSAGDGYTGEIRDIGLLLNNKDQPWTKSIADISAIADQGNAKKVFKPGDYLIIPVSVPEDNIVDGVKFSAIEDGTVKIVVTAVYADKVIFNFENVLFHAAMNNENTNRGGFDKTALCRYLNGYFFKCVFSDIEDYLLANKDGWKISLPTLFEVFGEGEKEVNWGEVSRHPYFYKCTNRIKVDNNDPTDTNWWWTSTASDTTNFCGVGSGGNAIGHGLASTADGGAAPAFCVRSTRKI